MKLTQQSGKIYLRDLMFEEVAAQYNTPFYLYDLEAINDKIEGIRQAFGGSLELFYAIKANPNILLLKAIRDKIDGVDIASRGELEISLNTGYEANKISFAGPGKTKQELLRSLEIGIGFISVESIHELREIEELVRMGAPKASILIRVNPLLFIKDFAIKMGGKPTHFGIDEEELCLALQIVKRNPDAFTFKGIHIYSGTQCFSEEQLARNLANTLEIAERVTKDFDMECCVINIGGGFGISYYDHHQGLNLDKLSDLFSAEFIRYQQKTGTNPRIILELGRYLVAEAGIYVTRVVSNKQSRGQLFYILDGGMNHHLSASGNLGATIRKNFLVRNLSHSDNPKITCNLVGPLCTPMDLMGKDVSVESPEIGDLVGFLVSGSYGYSASPLFFLGHELPVELVVNSEGIIVSK